MKKYKSKPFTILLMLSSFTLFMLTDAIAAPTTTATVKTIYVQPGGVVLFKLTNAVPAACNDSNYPFQFSKTDVAGPELLSMLMTAEATGKTISVGYYGDGTSRGSIAYLIRAN